jgi:NitT/TauT family transport system substrate-binding protein
MSRLRSFLPASPARSGALGLTATLCCALGLGGCTRTQPGAAPGAPTAGAGAGTGAGVSATVTKTRLVLNWVPEPEFGGFYAARLQGAFTQRGLDVEIVGGGAGVPVVQMVATGQADFGIVGGDELLQARGRGVDLVPLFATYQTSPQAILVHAGRGAKSLRDVLSGGTLALEPGLPYAQWLKRKYGFDKVQVVPYDGGVARFLKDPLFAQQCFLTAEPIAARREGATPQTFLIADDGFNPYLGVVVARRALVAERGPFVRSFVEAIRQGWRAYLDAPAAANAEMGRLNPTMTAETFALAAEAQRPLIENDTTRRLGLGAMEQQRWETLAQQLVELKIIDQAPTVTSEWVQASPATRGGASAAIGASGASVLPPLAGASSAVAPAPSGSSSVPASGAPSGASGTSGASAATPSLHAPAAASGAASPAAVRGQPVR